MAEKILYTNKEELIDDESIPVKNKVTADDMNEIKEVVNSHADDIETLDSQKADRTEIPTDLSELSNATTKFVNETQLANAVNDEKTARQEADNIINNTILAISVDYGRTIELSLNSSTFVLTATLKNKNGTVLSSSNVDLPIESMIINGSYDSVNKAIILTLQNGSTITIPVGDLISGLQSEITPQNKLSSDLVDDTNNTNKFVTQAEKNQIETNKNNIINLNENKENISNKVTELTEESTDIQYPSAKAVYDNETAIKTKLERYANTIETELEDSSSTGTELTLNGTAEFDVGLELNGNTEQIQTNGYQLIHTTSDFNQYTQGGINFEAYPDGTCKVYGTATATVNAYLNCNTGRFTSTNNSNTSSLSAGDYVYHATITKGNLNHTRARTGSTELTGYGNDKTFTLENDITNFNLYFRINSGVTVDDEFKIMLEKGSTIHDWEYYSNEKISPSPEYVQPIHIIKGSNTIYIENENKLENITWTEGKYLDAHNEEVDNNNWAYSDYLEIDKDDIYTSSCSGNAPKTIVYNENKNQIAYISVRGNLINKSKTKLNTYQNAKYIRVSTEKYYIPETAIAKGQVKDITLPTGMFMAKIETYEDKIQGNIDNWYIPNKILKIDSYNGETITTPYVSNTGGLDVGATVYYVGTETLPITDTTLITQLNNIKQAYTYQGQTNISQTNEDLPFVLKADFKLSNLLRIEALESALETVSSRVDLLE